MESDPSGEQKRLYCRFCGHPWLDYEPGEPCPNCGRTSAPIALGEPYTDRGDE